MLGIAATLLVASASYFAKEIKEHLSPSKQSKTAQSIEAKISSVAKEQSEIRRDQAALLNLATNNWTDKGSRTQILALDRRVNATANDVVDLQAWKADRDMRTMSESLNVQKAAKVAEEQKRLVAKPYWDASRPIYQYAVHRLEEIVWDLGRQRGLTVWTNFPGIPAVPTFGELGELGLGTNKNWHLKIVTDAAPALWIHSGNGLIFYLASNPQQVVVSLRDDSKSLFTENGVPTRFRDTVEPAIRDFVLELSERDQFGPKMKK